MVNFKSIADKAKDLVSKRGGTDSLKEDAGELKDIATGEGSITDKAKAAAAAIKDPGAEGEEGEETADAAKPRGEGEKPARDRDKPGRDQERPAREARPDR